MSENCNHDCSSCASAGNCSSNKESFLENLHEGCRVNKVIGVISGKGGVGKSLVTSLLAVKMQKLGYRCAVLDADITGPSIPTAFGLTEHATVTDEMIDPAVTTGGIQVMSLNLLLDNATDPVVWRGPVIAGAVKQFWTDVHWNEVDYMFVDMPPGTGDVPLTVFQSLPVDGVVVVTSPQELVEMIVEKAVNMAGMMDVKVLGLVENMSYFVCPDCKAKHAIYGESRADAVAARLGIPAVGKLPIDPSFARACDAGLVETLDGDWLDAIVENIRK